ncbi:hypothetical protein FB451DRAFT_1176686 [Mycena latifolia]|nr:hypothetical protein FB451DRAFT_1176686 [Mycena latifolia]
MAREETSALHMRAGASGLHVCGGENAGERREINRDTHGAGHEREDGVRLGSRAYSPFLKHRRTRARSRSAESSTSTSDSDAVSPNHSLDADADACSSRMLYVLVVSGRRCECERERESDGKEDRLSVYSGGHDVVGSGGEAKEAEWEGGAEGARCMTKGSYSPKGKRKEGAADEPLISTYDRAQALVQLLRVHRQRLGRVATIHQSVRTALRREERTYEGSRPASGTEMRHADSFGIT